MRKRCISCGLICFVDDESCKRCGSTELKAISNENHLSNHNAPESLKPNSPPNYFRYFLFAVGIEFGALVLSLPGLAASGMRHSANAPTSMFEMIAGLLVFMLHFPTLFINLALMMITQSEVFILLTPVTQIIFWTYFLARLNRKRTVNQKSAWR